LLDVGCGPGTISVDLGRFVAPGRVIGIDRSDEVIGIARSFAQEEGVGNVQFQTGDVYDLDFAKETFDVVYAHQVLQHLSDPVAALKEMHRVLNVNGVLGVRDADYGGFFWSPNDDRLDKWLTLYHQVARNNSAEPDAGRHLASWVRDAGFRDCEVTSSNWIYESVQDRLWWGGLWADRVRHSDFSTQALSNGFADQKLLDDIASAFLEWANDDRGIFVIVNIEVLARKS
jgi:SAM-dependent methyltransferase